MAGKRAPRHGNLALRRAFIKYGFDWVREMVKLYPELNTQGKLNALQTIAKYTEIEPVAPRVTVTEERTNKGETKALKASVIDNLPIEDLKQLAGGGYQEVRREYEGSPKLAPELLAPSAQEMDAARINARKKKSGE